MVEWNFGPEIIAKAQEIGVGDRVMAHWTEAECQDQEGTVVGVEIHRYGKVEYAVHLDGDLSSTDGFTHDRSGLGPGTIRLLSASPKPSHQEEGFDAWFGEQEGFSIRAERFEGDIEWLKAAYEVGRTSQAAENEELRKERDICGDAGNNLQAQLDHVSAAIGSVRWMDPPDGGSVPLGEQVNRMRADLEDAETKLAEAMEVLKPFAEYLTEHPFDLDNKGQALPDDTGPGWTYLTAGDFRRARSFLDTRGGGK